MARTYRVPYLVATLCWMVLIYYLSSIPDLRSSLPSMADQVLRKFAHMAEYAILYVLMVRSVVGVRYWREASILAAIGYALTDEFHQTLVAGRVGSGVDVVIDTVGIIIAYTVVRKKFPAW